MRLVWKWVAKEVQSNLEEKYAKAWILVVVLPSIKSKHVYIYELVTWTLSEDKGIYF